ncbi:unnamed protein product [Cyprideis torosa]|uniref:non-specific serine/threonine protein kinase n=1 Tax=Cyprideis torosa TaxID=163714 RepID=A0A7R8WF53_9CRUS|nr:unnamed protein product [Cyprideis torosa]CAG0896603.1 unnamed protein product [Cyprideis torosa]
MSRPPEVQFSHRFSHRILEVEGSNADESSQSPPTTGEKRSHENRFGKEILQRYQNLRDEWTGEGNSSSSSTTTTESDDGIRFADSREGIGQINRSQHRTRSLSQSGASQNGSLTEDEVNQQRQRLKKCTFTLYIEMELMELTLAEYISTRNEEYFKNASPAQEFKDRGIARRIFRELCWAVESVHERKFIHRDLKPSNVLLCRSQHGSHYSVRLSDFGFCTKMDDEFGTSIYRSVCGNVWYTAPEQRKGKPGSGRAMYGGRAKYGEEVDVYPLALILVELMMHMSSMSEKARVFAALRSPEASIPREVEESLDGPRLELLRRALSHDPSQRPRAKDIRLALQ